MLLNKCFSRLSASFAIALIALGGPALAQDGAIIEDGSAVVTGFSGTQVIDAGNDKVHPLDLTFIDPSGAALRVLDVSDLGGPAQGVHTDGNVVRRVTAGEIGQVFGVTLSDPDSGVAPDVFAAATSLYGLQIVGKRDDETIRLVQGEPGAEWMPGLFGNNNGGGPGTVWKIDGTTGEVSLFANIMSGPNTNAGAGLGGLAYDFVSKRLYVPNLETGFIHALDQDGREVAVFDHGTRGRKSAGLKEAAYDPTQRVSIEDPAFNAERPETWGYAPDKRLVMAVTVHNDRLYYSVADGPQIWSIGLDSKGGFLDDARFEFAPRDVADDAWITGITFDGANTLFLSQRGRRTGSYDYRTFAQPDEAAVLRYRWDEDEQEWLSQSDEFAIGLSNPHRSSNGGVALGYAYDSDGRMKSGTCRATLWTTGSHARDSGGNTATLQVMDTSLGQERTLAAPTSGSTALQGRVSGENLTELSPPDESWMIDVAGAGDGAADGALGGLALHTPNCDGETEVADLSERPEPIGPDIIDPDISWPQFYPGLDIAKSCAPAAFGGVIDCTITVTNTGTLPFFSPITVSDATTILNGPGAGGALNITAVTPDGPEWACTPTPTINLTCGLPPEHLLPGISRSFTVSVDTSTMVADGNFGFRNCASFGAPYWGFACDSAGSDITVTKTAEPGCVAGGDCVFNLAITNNSAGPFSGQVQLTDQMFLGAIGGPIPANISFNGDLGCAGGNPANLPFSCLSTLSLGPGETQSFAMTIANMPSPPNDYWARNCFAATAPGLVPGDLATTMPPGGGSLGSGGAVSCAWMQVGNPTDHANLKMDKTAQACGKIPGDPNTVTCDYTITITNTGPSPFNAPIVFDETVDPAATLIVADPNFTCAGAAPTYTCSTAGALPIAPNEVVSIAATVTTPRAVVEANVCRVPNTVTLTTPPVNVATNYLATDDTASAEGDAFLLEFDGGGAAIILCDPTNIKTTKVSKGPCVKADDGWDCEFEVTLLNTGPDPYKGKLDLVDVTSIAPTSVTYSGTDGWSRSPGVGHDLYHLPQRTIPKGESVTLLQKITVPDGNYCSVTSTAHMTFPVLDRHNKDKTDDTGIATAVIPRPECKRPTQCKPESGELETASGACACEPGYVRDRSGQCVGDKEPPPPPPPPPPEKELCPDGYPVPRNGVCPCRDGETWNASRQVCEDDGPGEIIDPVPPCRLLPGQIRTRDNRCICANGRKWNSKTYCERRPPSCKPKPGEVVINGRCQCPNGRTWNRTTYCDPPPFVCPLSGTYQAAPGVCCEIGEVYRRGRCRQPEKECRLLPGQIRTRDNRCICANGRKWNSKTYCDPPQVICPLSGTYQAAPGVCCQIGEVYHHGRCQKPDTRCDKPRYENRKGVCTCGPGKTYNPRRNTCDKDKPTDPGIVCKGGKASYSQSTGWICTCLRGESVKKVSKGYYRCIGKPDPIKECKAKGGTWNHGRCVMPPDPKVECKKKGWRWIRGKCLPPKDPGKECKAKGWNWTGSKCIRPPSPKEECKKKGWRWQRGKCLPPRDPAKECKAKGWNWTGYKCVKPTSPKEKCKKKGWNWTGSKCVKPDSAKKNCKAKGWRWKGGKCLPPRDKAAECRKKGWKWTGSKCVKPNNAKKNCKAKGWRWKKGKCLPPRDRAAECRKKGRTWTGSKCVAKKKPCPPGTKGPGKPFCKKIGGPKKGKPKASGPKKVNPKFKLPQKTYLGRGVQRSR